MKALYAPCAYLFKTNGTWSQQLFPRCKMQKRMSQSYSATTENDEDISYLFLKCQNCMGSITHSSWSSQHSNLWGECYHHPIVDEKNPSTERLSKYSRAKHWPSINQEKVQTRQFQARQKLLPQNSDRQLMDTCWNNSLQIFGQKLSWSCAVL